VVLLIDVQNRICTMHWTARQKFGGFAHLVSILLTIVSLATRKTTSIRGSPQPRSTASTNCLCILTWAYHTKASVSCFLLKARISLVKFIR
jgi:hypothetical protein